VASRPQEYIEEQLERFAGWFFKKYAMQLLDLYMQVVLRWRAGAPTPTAVLVSAFSYLGTCVHHAELWARLKPGMRQFMFEAILPAMALSKVSSAHA
jgi:hypothetical protein